MTTRNFDALFEPEAIALIGASNRAGSVGAVLARNLRDGSFAGPLFMVNPRGDEILGQRSYASIAALPRAPDLAVIATPPETVPGIVRELGARGCRAAVVITAGLTRANGLRQQVLDAAKPHLMRIIGPNCLGFLSPHIGLNASFAHLQAERGNIAFLTQSGAIATSILDWAKARGIGFSHIVSLGDMADVDFGDLLDFLALDPKTRAILLYVENVTQARKFMSAGRIAARAKPVIVVKGGRSDIGASAAASHSGAIAGADAVYDAAFRRAGMLRVGALRELFDAAETLSSGVRPRGARLTILTNGGGLGVLAADALDAFGGTLAPLGEDAKTKLDAALPANWSHANPIDILGDASGARYQAALEAVLAAREQDAVLVMNCPTGVSDSMEAAGAVLAAKGARTYPPMLACWMGDATAQAPRRRLSEAGLPNYETPDEAVRAFMQLVEYGRNQAALMETPEAVAARGLESKARARAVIEGVLAEGRTLLTAPEASEVLAAYGVPIVEAHVAATPEAAAETAARLGFPVALKILSRDITHKSDVGGVRLGLADAAAVTRAAEEMAERAARLAPTARRDGFIVQRMIARPRAHELILGAHVDRTFGPVLLFGQGGIAVEILKDRIVGLPPLNTALARGMIARTNVFKLLSGYRDRPPADLDAIARTLVALSDLIVEIPEIDELDINPLLADENGVLALDARIVARPFVGEPTRRLSIGPYPAHLAHDITLLDGAVIHLRPIRPEDETALITLGERTEAEHMRLRFHGPMKGLSHALAARLSQIDYDREMALIALEPDGAIAGVVRIAFDPNFETGEYAIIVRSDRQGRGLGRALMREALAHARSRGVPALWGDVLEENRKMIELARELGAGVERVPEGMGVVRTHFKLH